MKIWQFGANYSGTTVAMFTIFIVTALKRDDKIITHHGESDGDKSQSISFENTI
jgi:hypothetical protein